MIRDASTPLTRTRAAVQVNLIRLIPTRPNSTRPNPFRRRRSRLEKAAVIEPVISATADQDKSATKVSGTMRVNIDRLDNLMNLAGELVVNRARFVQISEQISPEYRKASSTNRIREFCDSLRQTIDGLSGDEFEHVDRQLLLGQLRSGLRLMDDHARSWEQDRHHLEDFGEAIDQLSRVSQGLQKGVLDTRMVPVGPLFNRFKRVTRDLSKERGKRVVLQIRGEKTELDKRMIDELVDPLVHLVRNSIDHGLESPENRVASGKPEVGTIALEATHSGNNVYIHVRDDGRGIDVDKIKSKLVSNRVLSESAAAELSREQGAGFYLASRFQHRKGDHRHLRARCRDGCRAKSNPAAQRQHRSRIGTGARNTLSDPFAAHSGDYPLSVSQIARDRLFDADRRCPRDRVRKNERRDLRSRAS